MGAAAVAYLATYPHLRFFLRGAQTAAAAAKLQTHRIGLAAASKRLTSPRDSLMANVSDALARVLPPPFFSPPELIQSTHAGVPRVACAGWPSAHCTRFTLPATTSIPQLLSASPYFAGVLAPAFVLAGIGALFSLFAGLSLASLLACPRGCSAGCAWMRGGGPGPSLRGAGLEPVLRLLLPLLAAAATGVSAALLADTAALRAGVEATRAAVADVALALAGVAGAAAEAARALAAASAATAVATAALALPAAACAQLPCAPLLPCPLPSPLPGECASALAPLAAAAPRVGAAAASSAALVTDAARAFTGALGSLQGALASVPWDALAGGVAAGGNAAAGAAIPLAVLLAGVFFRRGGSGSGSAGRLPALAALLLPACALAVGALFALGGAAHAAALLAADACADPVAALAAPLSASAPTLVASLECLGWGGAAAAAGGGGGGAAPAVNATATRAVDAAAAALANASAAWAAAYGPLSAPAAALLPSAPTLAGVGGALAAGRSSVEFVAARLACGGVRAALRPTADAACGVAAPALVRASRELLALACVVGAQTVVALLLAALSVLQRLPAGAAGEALASGGGGARVAGGEDGAGGGGGDSGDAPSKLAVQLTPVAPGAASRALPASLSVRTTNPFAAAGAQRLSRALVGSPV
jgi:hypothetical protein